MNGTTYQTYDLVLAAFLVAGDICRLTDVAGHDGGRKLFRFTPAPSKEQLIQFYSGEAVVSARRFAEAYASLKGVGYTMRDFA